MAPFRARIMNSSSRREAIVCLPEGEFRRESNPRLQRPTPHVRGRHQADAAGTLGVSAEGTLPRGRSGRRFVQRSRILATEWLRGAVVSRPAPGGGPIFCSPWTRNHTSPEAGSREGEQQYAVSRRYAPLCRPPPGETPMIAGAHPVRHVTEGSSTSLRASRTAVTIQSILRQRIARKPAPGHTWRGSPNGRAWSRSRLAHPHPYDSPCGSTVFCVRHWDLTPSVTQQTPMIGGAAHPAVM